MVGHTKRAIVKDTIDIAERRGVCRRRFRGYGDADDDDDEDDGWSESAAIVILSEQVLLELLTSKFEGRRLLIKRRPPCCSFVLAIGCLKCLVNSLSTKICWEYLMNVVSFLKIAQPLYR